ncbi:MAG: hypothetical protein WBB25_14900, partial [Sulfitobacter sp.]
MPIAISLWNVFIVPPVALDLTVDRRAVTAKHLSDLYLRRFRLKHRRQDSTFIQVHFAVGSSHHILLICIRNLSSDAI